MKNAQLVSMWISVFITGLRQLVHWGLVWALLCSLKKKDITMLFRKIVGTVAVVAVAVAALIHSSSAQASLVIQARPYSPLPFPYPGDIVAGPVADTGPASAFFTSVSGINILVLGAASNSPGNAISATLDFISLVVSNFSGAEQRIQIQVGAQNFAQPAAPPTATLVSSLSFTGSLPLNAGTATMTSFVDDLNGQNNSITGISSGAHSVDFSTPSGNSFKEVGVASLTGSFSLTQLYDITLANGTSVNINGSTSIIGAPSVPEPSSAVLFAGLFVLAGVARRFRRSTSSVALRA